ncbi:unnamed protein product, partial [Polarella glacialis]
SAVADHAASSDVSLAVQAVEDETSLTLGAQTLRSCLARTLDGPDDQDFMSMATELKTLRRPERGTASLAARYEDQDDHVLFQSTSSLAVRSLDADGEESPVRPGPPLRSPDGRDASQWPGSVGEELRRSQARSEAALRASGIAAERAVLEAATHPADRQLALRGSSPASAAQFVETPSGPRGFVAATGSSILQESVTSSAPSAVPTPANRRSVQPPAALESSKDDSPAACPGKAGDGEWDGGAVLLSAEDEALTGQRRRGGVEVVVESPTCASMQQRFQERRERSLSAQAKGRAKSAPRKRGPSPSPRVRGGKPDAGSVSASCPSAPVPGAASDGGKSAENPPQLEPCRDEAVGGSVDTGGIPGLRAPPGRPPRGPGVVAAASAAASAAPAIAGDGEGVVSNSVVGSSGSRPPSVGRPRPASAAQAGDASRRSVSAGSAGRKAIGIQSNRKLVRNALEKYCLKGDANREQREQVMRSFDEELQRYERFIILFRSIHTGRHDLRALYGHLEGTVSRVLQVLPSPPHLEERMVAQCLRYDSGGKEFKEIPGVQEPLSVADAVFLHPQWCRERRDVRQQLMADPKVQAAIQEQCAKSGQDAITALKDPAVQKVILQQCKDNFPKYASAAKDQIMNFANDPEVQKQAKAYANMAGAYALSAGGLLVAQIQQGPDGVRLLSFGGGVASVAIAVMDLINVFGILTNPVHYVLSVYQLIFSCTTMLFEASPEMIQKVSGLNSYQDMLIDKAKFLSETYGRGLFYIFQGTLWLCFASLTDILDLGVGLWMVFVGALNIMIHFGGFTVFQEKVADGYKSLSTSETGKP